MLLAPDARADFDQESPWYALRLPAAANPFSSIGVSSNARPALADLDDDGDSDLVVGNFSGSLRYYENTGTPTQAAYVQRTGSANPLDGFSTGTLAAPALGDLDGDGDLDLLLGDISDGMQYLRNTGTASAPAFTSAALPGGLTGLPLAAAPALVDLDADGDLDLFVGGWVSSSTGIIRYYQNKGTATAPLFAEATGSFHPIQNQNLATNATPVAGDLDGDGDFDLVAGDHDVAFHWWDNQGTPSHPDFVELLGNEPPRRDLIWDNSAPALADLDGDGDLDIAAGLINGSIIFYESFAAPFIAQSSLLASSSFSAGFGDGAPIHLIDGSGLSGTGSVALRVHDNNANASTMWHAGNLDGGLGGPTGAPPVVSGQTLVFDLFTPHDLYGVLIWNHNQQGLTARGVDDLQILVSPDSDPFTATFTNLGTYSLNQAAGEPGEPAQRISFSNFPVENARLVKLAIQSAHSGQSSDYVGLSEVRFAPEPGRGWLLASGGLLLVWLARWRRTLR